MKTLIALLAAGLAAGFIAASHAKLPAAAPKSDVEKKAEADKAAAAKTKEGDELAKAQDKAVANYKKRHPATMSGKKK
ncbi:MAG: hypothetical protein QOD26_1243 [Betaproteobacteria bacterium]|jgi:succinate dehydrogenase/fumarate reductase flavoprotein subunit|nr:hypothetical protein [Betaproteobacteria bacterium]